MHAGEEAFSAGENAVLMVQVFLGQEMCMKEKWKKGGKTLLFVFVIFIFAFSCIQVAAAEKGQEDIKEEVRRPMYDAAYLSDLLKGVGFAEETTNEVQGRSAAAGSTVYTSVLAADQGTIDMVRYSPDGQSWEMVDSWSEGVLGADGEWAFCADPTVSFQSGNKQVYDAKMYYSQYTIDTIGCAFAWYDEWKTTLDFSFTSSQDYFFKQILVWEVLNEVNGWYPGITLEFGNNVLCPDGVHYVSEYTWQVLQYGIEYAVDPEWREKWECSGMILKGNGQDLCQWEYHPAGGYIEIQKSSSDPGFSEGNSCYTLEGAEYGVYQKDVLKTVLVTDEAGYAKSEKLSVGEYTICEIKAPSGYKLDTKSYAVSVENGKTTGLGVKDIPVSAKADLQLVKVDAGTKGSIPQGCASLAGAQFAVDFYEGEYTKDSLPKEPDRTWILETKENEEKQAFWELSEEYKIGGDDFYYASESNGPVLPLGTIVIEEIKAPKGYLLKGAVFKSRNNTEEEGETEKIDTEEEEWRAVCVIPVKQVGEKVRLIGGNRYQAADKVIRGDFSFTKIEEKTQKAMADIPFRITSMTTKESHVIVTDENGYFSSSSEYVKHSVDTNAEKAKAGLWFGIGDENACVPVDDGQGALPFDTYKIEELRCEKNEGKQLYEGEFVISRDEFILDMGTIENADLPKENPPADEEMQKKEKQETIHTGDETVMHMYIGGILVSLGVLLLIFVDKSRKRR